MVLQPLVMKSQEQAHQILALRPVHDIRLGERRDRKCIQNDLDARRNMRVRWNRNYFYSSVRDARPNHFVCTSGRNAMQANYATLAQAYIVNRPLGSSFQWLNAQQPYML